MYEQVPGNAGRAGGLHPERRALWMVGGLAGALLVIVIVGMMHGRGHRGHGLAAAPASDRSDAGKTPVHWYPAKQKPSAGKRAEPSVGTDGLNGQEPAAADSAEPADDDPEGAGPASRPKVQPDLRTERDKDGPAGSGEGGSTPQIRSLVPVLGTKVDDNEGHA